MVPIAETQLHVRPAADEAEAQQHYDDRMCERDHETVRCVDSGWELVYCDACLPSQES